jgi:hypothetical protein
MRVLAIFALVALAAPCLIGASSAARAQQAPATPPAQPPLRDTCRADFQKFCSDVHPGSGRIAQCLLAHKDNLSAGCRDALVKVGAEHTDKSDAGKPQS